MIKRRSKTLSIVMSLCLCLAIMAPIFVAPDVAQASSTYKVMSAPTLKTQSGAADLGAVRVTLDDTAVAAYGIVTVSLPSDLTFTTNGGTVGVYPTTAAAAGKGIAIVAPGLTNSDCLQVADFDAGVGTAAAPAFRITPNKTFDIKLAQNLVTSGDDQYFYIYFNAVDLNNYSGDLKVTMMPPSGSPFTYAADLVIGKTTSEGSTLSTYKDVKDLTDAGGDIDIITVHESSPNTFESGDKIKLEILSNGFEFDTSAFTGTASATSPVVTYGWDFGNSAVITGNNVFLNAGTTATFTDDNQKLTYVVLPGVANVKTSGKISFTNLKIKVDDSKVKVGDICEIKVSGDNVTDQTFTVANYVDYGVTVKDGTSEDLVAGQVDQEIGEFYINEGAPASLLQGRIVSMELPSGCEWNGKTGSTENTTSGSITFNGSNYPTLSDDRRTLKYQVKTASSTDAAKVKFKDFDINVAPNFTGTVELKISGSAGAEGTVKVAEVKPAVSLSVASVANIELGKANQKIDDIVITEGIIKGILADEGTHDEIVLRLDDGYRFAKTPTITVTEGDIDIDANSVDTDNGDRDLVFDIDGQSAKTASKITISDIYLDAYRTAPEGPITLKFDSSSTALNENVLESANAGTVGQAGYATSALMDKSAGKVVIANCVTPSMKEGSTGSAVGQFRISSNIYEVNGVSKVMDAAPYIKAGRTYVPVKYLGLALGVAESDIVWDEATQKVTLTLGDKKVELTIGSTTITVNGEAKTMDVAPEINNGRTMLPAKYVAEGLGYTVGWDAATQTVLVSK